MNPEKWEKVKEYDTFILYRNKKTGIRECFMKTDLIKREKSKKKYLSGWER